LLLPTERICEAPPLQALCEISACGPYSRAGSRTHRRAYGYMQTHHCLCAPAHYRQCDARQAGVTRLRSSSARHCSGAGRTRASCRHSALRARRSGASVGILGHTGPAAEAAERKRHSSAGSTARRAKASQRRALRAAQQHTGSAEESALAPRSCVPAITSPSVSKKSTPPDGQWPLSTTVAQRWLRAVGDVSRCHTFVWVSLGC
jgi:hypothetical protein